jgi:hypothetical protein
MPCLAFGAFFHCAKFICTCITNVRRCEENTVAIDEAFQMTCPGGVIGTVVLRICSFLVSYKFNILPVENKNCGTYRVSETSY